MKTNSDKQRRLFLVNRHTGKSLPWNPEFGEHLPPYSFFRNGDFLQNGQIVELVALEETEAEYFGIMYRKDQLTVLERGRLETFGFKPLDD